jgi:predicted DNA-binding protein (MmcQ/YjbR family)
MMSLDQVRQIAMSFEGVTEEPHFDKISFRVKKKIFLTVDEKNMRACAQMSPEEQNVYSMIDQEMIYPVPNKWGLKGATYLELNQMRKELFTEIVMISYNHVTSMRKASRTNRK